MNRSNGRNVTASGEEQRYQRTLWFDVGHLLAWPDGHVTGIQRTALAVLCELRARSGLPFCLRYCKYESTGGFVEVSDAAVDVCIAQLLGSANVGSINGRRAMAGAWERLGAMVENAADAIYRRVPAELAPPSRDLLLALVSWLHACRVYFAKRARSFVRAYHRRAGRSGCIFSAGDVLLDLGSSWTSPGYTSSVEDARKQCGLWYAVLLYDLIPWKLPILFPGGAREQFVPWVQQTIQVADLLLTISERTRADILHLMTYKGWAHKGIEVIRLGDTPPRLGQGEGAIRAALRSLARRPYVLSVGTIEVRKDHRLLFHVWSALLKRYGESVPPLVWVGKWGWLVRHLKDEIKEEMAKDIRLREKLVILGGVSDPELDFLYENCLFTLFPSHYEGWGLPVAESVACGKYCVASNAASIPEIAGNLIDYHDPGDFSACYRLVERALFDARYLRAKETEIRANYRPHSWADCTDMLIEKIGFRSPRGVSVDETGSAHEPVF